MDTTDLTRIERSIFIHAPRARVWRAIADVAEFAAWFHVIAEGEFQPNTRVRMTSTYPGHEGVSWYVTVESVEPERRLSWRWNPGAADPPPDEQPTLVEFLLTDEDGGTRVTLIESGFDRVSLARRAKAYEDNSEGWKIQMASLHDYLEHGA